MLRLEARVADIAESSQKLAALQAQQHKLLEIELHKLRAVSEEHTRKLEQQDAQVKTTSHALNSELQRTLTTFGAQVSKAFDGVLRRIKTLETRVTDIENSNRGSTNPHAQPNVQMSQELTAAPNAVVPHT